MRFWLLPFCVSCEMLCRYKLLLLLVPSAAVCGFDAGVSGGLDAGGAGQVGKNAAACSVHDFSVAAAHSSAGGDAVCQVMNPWPSGVVPSSLVEGATVSSNCLDMI
jgi:hypothetical protein